MDAISSSNKALWKDDALATAWSHKGNALRRLGRQSEALKAYQKAIDIDPKASDPWYGKGTVPLMT